MAEYLRQQHFRDMTCTVHDLGVMGSNNSCVELGMCSTSDRGGGNGRGATGKGRMAGKGRDGEGGQEGWKWGGGR